METIIGILFISIAGGLLQGITGIGLSMIVMAAGTMFLPYGEVANINRILGLIIAVYTIFRWKGQIRWKVSAPVMGFSLIFGTVGIDVLTGAQEQALRKILGVVLLLLVFLTMYLQRKKICLRVNLGQAALFGAAAGICNGLFGIIGPVLAIYYCNTIEKMEEYRGTLNAHFVILSAWSNLYYLMRYGYTWEEWKLSAVGAIGILAATYAAFRWIRIRNKHRVTNAMLLVTTVMAVTMLL